MSIRISVLTVRLARTLRLTKPLNLNRFLRETKETKMKVELIDNMGTDDTVASSAQVSDGYHTFEELYNHRMILFSIICNSYPSRAWKSKLHHDGTMYDNYFIVGINTPEGNFTYHYHLNHWDKFQVRELPNAPEWDGHTSDDIERLYSLL